MEVTFRNYQSLKFKYLNVKDSDYNGLNDFDQRSLVIKHFENKLHVIFSYKILLRMISFIILIGCFIGLFLNMITNLIYIGIITSLIFYFISIILNEKYKRNVLYYRMSISLMNDMIFNKYGIMLSDVQ